MSEANCQKIQKKWTNALLVNAFELVFESEKQIIWILIWGKEHHIFTWRPTSTFFNWTCLHFTFSQETQRKIPKFISQNIGDYHEEDQRTQNIYPTFDF